MANLLKQVIITVSISCLMISTCGAQNKDNTAPCPDSLASDFGILTEYLEQTHPDPYTGFGGRVFFNIKAHEVKEKIASGHYSLTEFAALANEFMAQLQDGHTSLFPPASGITASADKTLKGILSLRCVPDGLIVGQVSEKYKDILGSSLISVNEISTDSLLKQIASLTPCENKYGAYAKLTNSYYRDQLLPRLFSTADTLTFKVKNLSGDTKTVSFPFNSSSDKVSDKAVSVINSYPTGLGEKYLEYGFADTKKDIMIFRVTSIMARENFEFTLKNNWPGAFEQLENHYKWTLNKEIPLKQTKKSSKRTSDTKPIIDTAAALAGIPSFSELFYNMLSEMQKNGSQNLIIDLRNNGGGWTPITLASIYMLYGDKYLSTDMNTQFYKLVSPLLLQKENSSLEHYSNMYGRKINMGDFLIPGTPEEIPIETRRENFTNSAMCCIPDKLSKDGKPVYTPENIYVITNERTFSAAFHYAFYLWKMGATIVGVPSSQAPNTYMEMTNFKLPYTQLQGSISNAMQVFLPADDIRAKIFLPDIQPSYDDYLRYKFDANSELLFLIDKIKN